MTHPVLTLVAAPGAAPDEVAGVDPISMTVPDKQTTLTGPARAEPASKQSSCGSRHRRRHRRDHRRPLHRRLAGRRDPGRPRRRSVMVTLDYQTLVAGIGMATTPTGESSTAGQARRLACQAGIIPVVLGSKSEIGCTMHAEFCPPHGALVRRRQHRPPGRQAPLPLPPPPQRHHDIHQAAVTNTSEPPRRVRRPIGLRAPGVAGLGGERSEPARPRRV